jgi:hypothetical protein
MTVGLLVVALLVGAATWVVVVAALAAAAVLADIAWLTLALRREEQASR